MDFLTQLEKDGVNISDYYSLRRRKRELLSIINADTHYSRLLSKPMVIDLKLRAELDKKLGYLKENNMRISDIHDYIKFITDKLNEFKERDK